MVNDKELSVLTASPIFAGLATDQIKSVLYCLQASIIKKDDGQLFVDINEKISGLFLVCSGCVELLNYDSDGRKNIINILYPGECFCENAGVMDAAPSSTQAEAVGISKIMRLDINRIFAPGSCRCEYKLIVMQNLVSILSDSNNFLQLRTTLLSQKKLRSKLMIYLHHLSVKQNSSIIRLPFNRTDLASFLSADRSALSRELGRLKSENLISEENNEIRIAFTEEDVIA